MTNNKAAYLLWSQLDSFSVDGVTFRPVMKALPGFEQRLYESDLVWNGKKVSTHADILAADTDTWSAFRADLSRWKNQCGSTT